jgi:hypothetical protein
MMTEPQGEMVGLFDGFEGYRVADDDELDNALTHALVAVDANVLLNLYRYNATTTADLLAIFDRLGDRLVIPHQAMREFHRNRLAAIGNPDAAIQEVRSLLQKNQRSAADALSRWAKQVALADEDLADLVFRIETAFTEVLDVISAAQPDRSLPNTPAKKDRVLNRLGGLLAGKVLPRPPDEVWNEMIAEGKRRVDRQEPPGYLDADKDDTYEEGAAGDYLVYRQACEEAAERGLDLVIVTGDEKDDWWWRHRSVIIGPRQEMAKEFHDLTGRRLHLLRPRDLLSRSATLDVKVNPSSVEDAQRNQDELEPLGVWTAEAVRELLFRLDAEQQVQGDVIREAAALGGIISREAIYGLCGFHDERMLRGFTKPTARITADLQSAGRLPDRVAPMLKPLYPDSVRASGFRIPPEVVTILGASVFLEAVEEELAYSGGRLSKYQPLSDWLTEQTRDQIPITFSEVEEVLAVPLAPSARNHQPYWYSVRNSLGKAIAAGGFKASRVNLTAETATLVRI